MSIKIDIFSGFLGAGKTTLIKKLLEEGYYSNNTVIIENEFGKVAIDGSFLRKTEVKIKEINAGCICCTITGDFHKALKEIYEELKPETIIIEPSGVGKLSEVLTAVKTSDIKNLVSVNSVVTLVDATKFKMYITNFGQFYRDQIRNAEIVILTRTELLRPELIEAIACEIKALNSALSIITTPISSLSAEQIMNSVKRKFEEEVMEQTIKIKRAGFSIGIKNLEKYRQAHRADEVFDSFGAETSLVYDKASLVEKINRLTEESRFGTVLRAKGILQLSNNQWIEFDYVPNELNVREALPNYTGKLCVIGSKLNKEELKKLFK